MLFEQLSVALRGGTADLKQFISMWRSAEMNTIWEHVKDLIKKDGGQLLQPTGMWERDYGTLLGNLKEQCESGEGGKGKEDVEQAKSAVEHWREDVQLFITQKRVPPGVRVVVDQHRAVVGIVLVTAGLSLEARADGGNRLFDGQVPEWRVLSIAASMGQPESNLEADVCDWLNHRPRRWDVVYLLVSSTDGGERERKKGKEGNLRNYKTTYKTWIMS